MLILYSFFFLFAISSSHHFSPFSIEPEYSQLKNFIHKTATMFHNVHIKYFSFKLKSNTKEKEQWLEYISET